MENSTPPVQQTLLPALLQCFGIIFIGIILGKTKILGKNESHGLSMFVQKLSLPALIFTTVSTIQFQQVRWAFIAAIFIVKGIIFTTTAIVSMLLTRPVHLGKAGIYSIAATQSNDFALGYPLLVSLYQKTHPEYPLYLYIIAPIQLLVFNSIGFFFLETEKKTQNNCRIEKYHFLLILKDTILNPVIFMTVLGLAWNVSFNQTMLPILGPILSAFSNAFPATALLLLGYTMTERNEKPSKQLTLPITVIILTKNLIFPMMLHKCTSFMLRNCTKTVMESFSTFGFLYGTIPTAPTVYVFARQFSTCVDSVSRIIIGSTLFSAPLMFASASVISLSQIGIKNMPYYLSQTISCLSAINMFCNIWLVMAFYLGKRWKNVSFGVTFILILAQFFMSLGGIFLFFSPKPDSTLFYIHGILTNGSIYSTSMCTFLLSLLLLIIRMRSLCFILQAKVKINFISVIICFVMPYGIASCLFFSKTSKTEQSIFQLGLPQIITTFIIRLVCLLGTAVCLILQQIYLKRNSMDSKSKNSYRKLDEETDDPISKQEHVRPSCSSDIEDLGTLVNVNCAECDESVETPEVCDVHYHCSTTKRFECAARVSRYISENNEIGTGLNDNENFFKHVSFLIALSVAMTLSIFSCLGKLVLDEVSGIFIEIEFLDCIVNYSLGILCFIMFGLDKNILNILYTKLSFLKNIIIVNHEQKTCEEFSKYYLEKCEECIGRTTTVKGIEHRKVFHMDNLVLWLIEWNVASCRDEALRYVKYFMKNQLIKQLDIVQRKSKPLYFFSIPDNASPNM